MRAVVSERPTRRSVPRSRPRGGRAARARRATASRVGRWSRARRASRERLVGSSPARTSTASAPWPGAGAMTSGPNASVTASSRPSRARPARARTTASRSPVRAEPPTRPRRVSTLPRMSTTSRSGRAASSWAARRGEPVPTRAPGGRSASVSPSRAHRASAGSSRGGTAPMTQAVGVARRQVLEGVDGDVAAAVEQRVAQGGDEHAGAAEARQRPGQAVAVGPDVDGLEGEVAAPRRRGRRPRDRSA